MDRKEGPGALSRDNDRTQPGCAGGRDARPLRTAETQKGRSKPKANGTLRSIRNREVIAFGSRYQPGYRGEMAVLAEAGSPTPHSKHSFQESCRPQQTLPEEE